MRAKMKMRLGLMEEQRNHRRLRRVRTLAIAAAVEAVGSVLVPRAMGQIDTWTGGTDNTWLNGSNWNGAHAPPQSGDALVFNGTNTQGNLSLNNNLTSLSFTVAGITFSSGSAAYVIGDGTATDTNAGNAFTLTSGITNSSTAAVTINDPITLSGNQSFYAATAAGTLTLGGNITGSGVTLTTNGGTGGAQVASNTTFTGAVSLGALLAQGNSNDGSTYTSNPTTTFNNANLTVAGNVSVGRSNLVFGGNTTANITGTLGTVGSASADWANVTIQGSANVSAGSLNMTGSAATGQFTLNGGTLTTGSISAIDSTSGGYIVHNVLNGTQIIASQSNSSFLTITKSSAFSGSNEVFVGNNGALFNTNGFNIATNTTLQNDTGATGFLTKTGSGTLTLTAAEAYTGVTTVSAGTLQIGDGTSGHDGSIAGASIVDNSVLAYDTNANQAYSGIISGNGSLNKIGAGVLVLSGSNSYSGGTNISAGTLRVQAPIAQVTSGSQLYLNAASLTGTANGATVTTWTDLSGNGRNTSAGTGTVTFQSTGVHGNPTVVFNGSSVLNDALSASNTTGTIFIVEQTGNTTNPNGAFFGSNGAGGQEFRQAGTQLQFLSRGIAPLGNTSSGTLTTSGQILAVTFTTGANGTQFYVNGSSVGTTQNGNVSFTSGLTSQIGGSQAFSGGYEDFIGNISAVVVYNTVLNSSQITATSSALNSEFFGSGSGNQLLPSGGPVTLSASGASLDLNGWNQSIGSLSGVAGSTITLGNAVLTVNPNGATSVFAGNISDSGGASSSTGGALSLAGTGTLILAGSNSYTGVTTIGSGTTLQLGNGTSDGIIAGTSGVTDNGALVYNLLASRSASYAITGNGTVTVNDTGATQGAISLSSSSSYTGATLVSVGSLTIDHSAAHTGALGSTAITVASAGVLAVKGATTIGSGGLTNNGGVVSLADGTIASVTEGGNLTFSSGTLNEDILSGGTSDILMISGNASISGTNTINLSGTLGVHTYTLVTAAGGLGSGFVIGTRPSGFFTLSLGNSTATQEILTVTGTPASPTEYWTGAASASGAPSQSIAPDTNNNWGFGSTFNTAKSNWSTDAAGANDALQVPGPSTDVVFTAGNATSVSGALNTQLDATYSIKGITFDTSSVTSQTSATGPISSVGINTKGFTLTIGVDGLTVGVNDNSSTTLSGNGAVLLNGNQTWANNSGNPLAVSAPITGQSAGGTNTLTFNGSGSGNVTLSGVISDGTSGGNLGLVVAKSGTGLLALNGNNTFTGGLTLSSGIVQLGNPGALNSTTPNAVTFSSGSTGDLQLNGNSITVPSLNSSGGTPIIEDASATATAATLTANIASGTSTYGGVLQDGSGGGILSLTKSGSGTLVLSGTSNTYTGVTDFSAGITNVASLANYGVASSIGARTAGQETASGDGIGILIDGGTLQYTGSGNQSTNRQIRLGPGTNTIDSSGAGTLSFTFNGNNTNLFETTTSPNLTLTGNNTGANTFAINLTNGVSVVKTGVGYWNLSGNNSSTNGITISAGTLALSGSNSYTGALLVRDGATLQLQANAANTNGANISYAIGSPSSFAFSQGSGSSSATMQLRGDSSVTFANTTPSSGTGGTTLYYDVNNFGGADTTTGQTFTVGGYATYQTTINVSGGHGYALTLGNITNANSAYLNVNANMANLNMGSISGLNGATLTVGGASNTNILGVISSGTVTKTGAGALTLSASNTYTGNTLVTGGTLIVPSTGSIVGSGLSINDNNVAGNYTGVIYTAGTIATTGDILTARGQNAGSNVTGIIYQTGGSVSDGSTNDVYVALGSGTGGSTVNGTYNISGGSLTPGRQLFLGGYNSSLSSNTTECGVSIPGNAR
jgi:autotransporter-associated beta strand protein